MTDRGCHGVIYVCGAYKGYNYSDTAASSDKGNRVLTDRGLRGMVCGSYMYKVGINYIDTAVSTDVVDGGTMDRHILCWV